MCALVLSFLCNVMSDVPAAVLRNNCELERSSVSSVELPPGQASASQRIFSPDALKFFCVKICSVWSC